eukprot:864200-Pleurochrysis_carterae.AAC.3
MRCVGDALLPLSPFPVNPPWIRDLSTRLFLPVSLGRLACGSLIRSGRASRGGRGCASWFEGSSVLRALWEALWAGCGRRAGPSHSKCRSWRLSSSARYVPRTRLRRA